MSQNFLSESKVGPAPLNSYWTPLKVASHHIENKRIGTSKKLPRKSSRSKANGVTLSTLTPTFSPDRLYFHEDSPLHQEGLSSKCVEEAGQFLEKLGEQMQIDLSKIMHGPCDYDDSLSIDSEL